MVIAKSELTKLIKNRTIVITPFKKSQIGPGSIDLSLSSEFRRYACKRTVAITEQTDYKNYTDKFKSNEIIINPGELVLGITKEKIKLPENICGWLQGRSRFARLGLSVHVTAGFVQPGSENQQVLEMINLGPNPLKLKAGAKIVQLILEYTDGKGRLTGRFKNQVL